MLNLKRKLSQFLCHDDRGGMTMLMLVLFLGIVFMTGLALDLAEQESERADLQSALDRGVLSAAQLSQTLEPKEVIESYLASRTLSSGAVKMAVQSERTVNSSDVFAQARTSTNTMFMRMTGVDTLAVPASSRAVERVQNVEISLILDISGSMRFDERVLDLIPAAESFLRKVTRNGESEHTTINVVRYAGQTNPGAWMFERLGGYAGSDEEGNTVLPPRFGSPSTFSALDDDDDEEEEVSDTNLVPWAHDKSHCFYMDARSGDISGSYNESTQDLSGLVPSGHGGDFSHAHLPGLPDFPPTDAAYLPLANNPFTGASPKLTRTDEIKAADSDPGFPTYARQQVAHFHNWSISDNWMKWGWCPSDEMSIRYMQNDLDNLIDEVANIIPTDYVEGNLHDGTGTYNAIKWGLALLNPSSAPIMREMALASTDSNPIPGAPLDEYTVDLYEMGELTRPARPADWDHENTLKVIVLMTDGKITEQADPDRKDDPEIVAKLANAEILSDGDLSRDDLFNKNDGKRFFYYQCKLAKEYGVQVFTIAFETPNQDEMRTCASPSKFYEADKEDIDEKFDVIASTIERLKLIDGVPIEDKED